MRSIGKFAYLLVLPALAVAFTLGRSSPSSTHATGSPTLLRHPYLQQMTTNSVIIVWATDKDGPSEVHYGTGALSSTADATSTLVEEPSVFDEPAASYYVHVANLTSLQPGTTYHYTVVTGGTDLTSTAGLSFHTDSGASDPSVRMLVFGDSGTGLEGQLTLRDRMLDRPFDLALHTGDVVYPHGTFNELELYYFDVYKDLVSRLPFYLVLGNHEYDTLGGQPFINDFYLPDNADPAAASERYYSFDYGSVHVVALDSEILADAQGPATSQQMLDWLDEDLAAIDAALVLQRSAGLLTTPVCSSAADVNGDGRIDAIDAALILQFVAGLLDNLPP